MDTGKEKLVLNQNLAAVRIENDRLDDESGGVATVIPVGEIIEIDRVAPRIGRLQRVVWNGSSYGVFPEDLRDRELKSAVHHDTCRAPKTPARAEAG